MSSRRSAGVTRLAVVLLALVSLEAIVAKGWINPLFVARPSTIVETLAGMLMSGQLFKVSGITLFMVAMTFVSATLLGLPAGYLLWRRPILGRALENLLGSLFASPLILLYPVFLVIFGRTLTAIMAQALLVGIIPIILGTRTGLRQVRQTFIDVGLTLQLNRWQMFRHILLPAAAPVIFTGLRVGLIYMLLSIVAMEFVVALGGIGNLVSDAYFRLDTESLYVGVAVVIVFAVGLFQVLFRGQKIFGSL